jgi:hypothetical protein
MAGNSRIAPVTSGPARWVNGRTSFVNGGVI